MIKDNQETSNFPVSTNKGKNTIMSAAAWKNQQSAKAKTKAQISFAVTAKLISAFVFPTQIVPFLYFLNPKFPASIFCDCTTRFVSDLVGNFKDRFSHVAAHISLFMFTTNKASNRA